MEKLFRNFHKLLYIAQALRLLCVSVCTNGMSRQSCGIFRYMCLVYSNELPGRCVCVQKEQAGVFVQVEWSGSFVQFWVSGFRFCCGYGTYICLKYNTILLCSCSLEMAIKRTKMMVFTLNYTKLKSVMDICIFAAITFKYCKIWHQRSLLFCIPHLFL